MASYSALHSRGDPLAANRHTYLYLYPNTSSENSTCENEVADAIKGAFDQLYDNAVIDYYEININYDYPNKDDSTKSDFQTGFYDEFLDNEGDYRDYTGCHVGVANGYDHAGAENANSPGGSAFATAVGADVGTAGSQSRYTNFAVQEPMHSYMRWDLSEVRAMGDGDSHMHEHDLGVIYSGLKHVSPLATLYESTHAQHGDCTDAASWAGTYSNSITNCTIDAVDYTASYET